MCAGEQDCCGAVIRRGANSRFWSKGLGFRGVGFRVYRASLPVICETYYRENLRHPEASHCVVVISYSGFLLKYY